MAAVIAGGALASRPVGAVGTLSSGGEAPLEQRVALAVGPDRTTLWTSVRVDAPGGAVAIIAPALPGASLDWSSSAWFEALEDATAPRIRAPSLDCRGAAPAAPLDVAGETGHEVPLPGGQVTVLADAAAVTAWAAQNGLAVPEGLAGALGALAGMRFVAARFDAPGGTTLTPTLRIVSPSPLPELPLVLTRAGAEPLLVTTWVIGEGRAHIDGAAVAAINRSELTFDAASGKSAYAEARESALRAAGPGSALIEAAGHGLFVSETPIPGLTDGIPALVGSYFERAAAYGDGLAGAAACVTQAEGVLSGAARVAASCPREALGVVDGAAGCTESVGAGEADPELLRCGAGADDLAVALSGISPILGWITRQSMIIPANGVGTRSGVSLPGGAEVSPLMQATGLACEVPVRRVPSSGCGCSGTEDTVVVGVIDVVITDSDEEPPESYYEEEDCEGDTADTYSSDSGDPDDGGCSGDSSDSSDSSDSGAGGTDSSEDDGCSGDTSDTGSSSSGGSGGDSSGSSDGCGSDTTDTSGGGSSGDGSGCKCSVRAPKHRAVRVRLSPLMLGALLLIAPLRRALRPRRRRRCG